MQFHSVTGRAADREALLADYRSAHAVGAVRAGEGNLFFRARLKTWFIPYPEITRCFRRVQLVPARMCCGRGDLQIENLVVCGAGGELAEIQLPGTHAAKALMQELQEKLPHASFGTPKQEADS